MPLELQQTERGMGFTETQEVLPEQQTQQGPVPMPPHPSKGKYGPILNYVFGERIEEFAPKELEPIIGTIQQAMRGKSGFIQLGEQFFYKNGTMIELVENPQGIPEEARILNIDKK